jgi:predicted nucleotide-binding protein
MYNTQLADKIVDYLNSAFPDKLRLGDLQKALPEFSDIPEEEWLKAFEALEHEGRVEFKGLRSGYNNKLQMVANVIISNAERRRLAELGSTKPAPTLRPSDPEKTKHVWVVHGRDSRTKTAMFTFLFALGLKPTSFGKARQLTGKAMPHISEILAAAFQDAQAVIVLLTPDDEGRLRPEFLKSEDEPSDRDLTPQPRLNVIFEAGMAAVSHPEQTIFVKFGYVRPFSDVAGLHYVSMDGSAEQRRELALRLRSAGCPINLDDDSHWLNAGDFALPEISGGRTKQQASDTLKNAIAAFISSLKLEWENQKKHRPIMLGPLFNIIERACRILLELHTQAEIEGAHETAAKLAEGYQALKKYEGAESTVTLDFDDLAFITEVDDAIARLKSAV